MTEPTNNLGEALGGYEPESIANYKAGDSRPLFIQMLYPFIKAHAKLHGRDSAENELRQAASWFTAPVATMIAKNLVDDAMNS